MTATRTETGPADTALLVIDVQAGLFRKSTPIWRAEELLASLNALIAAARAASLLVVYIRHSSDKVLPYGSPDWVLHPRLTPPEEGDLLIEKEHGNAFERTVLAAHLGERAIRRLVVGGLVTHGCVRATVEGALALGYGVTLAADAHSSYSKDAPALAAKWNAQLGAAGAVVLPAAEITFGRRVAA